MLFSRKWIGDYVDLPEGAGELASQLTDAGFNVELIDEVDGDHVFDIDVTTNRPDCMNHLGLAREVSVIRGVEMRWPDVELAEVGPAAASQAKISIENPELCRRYVGKIVRDVKIGPSPGWLVERLEAIGLRSISNVVDVTNFVLWETGQPLHAFDLDLVEDATIVVREARQDETLTTLDGEERKLEPGMLVIADSQRPVALAGVMGGADSEVGAETRHVLIESACFDAISVRRTARSLGMHTDASHRFERGSDPEICLRAAERAAALLAELADGEVLEGAIDVHPRPFEAPTIPLDPDRVSTFAGIEIPAADSQRWLEGLGCEVDTSQTPWQVRPPSWRGDLELTADLYEEVLRLHGFDDIPATLPTVTGSDGPRTPRQRLRRRLRTLLQGAGFAEVVNYAFVDRASDARWPSPLGEAAPLALANPLSDRYDVMRRSLLPGLHATAEFNRRRGAEALRIFEIGHVFAEGKDERETLALLIGGTPGAPWDRRETLDFFDLKGIVEALGEACDGEFLARPAELPSMTPGRTAELLLGEHRIGTLGQVADSEQDGYALFAAEIELEPLEGQISWETQAPSRFPGISMDLTLTHELGRSWQEVDALIAAHRPADLESWGLQVRYQGKGVPEGHVNTTIRFRYVSTERSLTQDEVNARQEDLTRRLQEAFGRS